MDKNYIPYYLYKLSGVCVKVFLVLSVLFNLPGLIIVVITALLVYGIARRKSIEEQYPEKFKRYVRESRTLYQCIQIVIMMLLIMTPSFMISHFPNHLVATTRIAILLEVTAFFIIEWQNYKWRTLHKDKVK